MKEQFVRLQELKMDKTKISEFLQKNSDKDYAWLAGQIGISADAVRKRYRALGLPNKRMNAQTMQTIDPEKQFQLDMEKLRLNHEDKKIDKKYKVAMDEIMRLRGDIETLTTVSGTVSTYKIKSTSSNVHEATAFAIASDWHVAEAVDPETVDGTNEYSMKIAKARAEAFFKNTLKLVTKEQQDAKIDTLVLALLGDFISGHIHDELMETCEVSPVEEAIFAQNLLASGIEYLLANSKLKLIIPTAVGNHSRITEKVHVSTETGNSLEWMIYNNLALHFQKEKRVQFLMSKSYFTFLDIYGFTIRLHHGHAIKFGGNIGGVTIPVMKALARYDMDKKAYLDIFGHFHNRFDGGKFIINGSLIGNTPYGKRLGFTGRPEQTFFLIDKVKGKTINAPIFVD